MSWPPASATADVGVSKAACFGRWRRGAPAVTAVSFGTGAQWVPNSNRTRWPAPLGHFLFF
eukprot:14026149-Alexandrium_andersonii.AAC.1